MATRGTYQVNGKLLYNHWDNYPSGAAMHLFGCIKKFGNLNLFSVIRGMERIEETNSIFDGPAEYHYKIDKDSIRCYAINTESDQLVFRSGGTIKEWINEQLKGELEETDNPDDYTLVDTPHQLKTISDAKTDVSQTYQRAAEMFDKGHIGNSSSEFSNSFRCANIAGIKIDELKKEYLEKYSPGFTKAYNHADGKYFDNIINEK